MYDDIPSWSDLLPMQSKDFADPPADPVAPVGVAERLIHAAAKSRDPKTVGAKENHELPARAPPAGAIEGVEIGGAHQPAGARPAPLAAPRPARRR
jgi:hypothetical protein